MILANILLFLGGFPIAPQTPFGREKNIDYLGGFPVDPQPQSAQLRTAELACFG